MASPLPAPDTADSITISPVVVEWPGNSGELCFLGIDNPRAVALSLSTFQLQTTLDLRVSLELRKPIGKTKLHLYIPPDRIISASMDHTSRLPDSAAISHQMACLRLHLDCPVDFVAPSWPLRPTNSTHNALLELVQVLARQTTIGLHFPTHVSDGRLERLYQMLLRHELTPAPLDLKSLYTGQGGVLVKKEQLAPQHITHSPPSYDEIEAGPSDTRPAVTLKKRRTESPTNSLIDLDVIGGICSKIIAEQLGKLEERFSQSMKEQEEKYETRLKEQAERYEIAMQEQEERYRASLEEYSKSCDSKLEELEDEIADAGQHCEDQISYQVDELRTDMLAELEDLKAEAAQSIQDDITSAVDQMKNSFFGSEVNIVGGRLELS